MKIKTRKTWKNSIKHEKAQPVQFIKTGDPAELSTIIKDARQNNFTVKAIGTGHSFNDIACSNGYMVDISEMNKILPLPPFVRSTGKKLVQVEAGITIRHLNNELDKLDLSVINLGGIDHQTIAGAIATATHGSGIGLQAIHSMVRSMVLVAGDGNVYRIEPTNGISDPAMHQEPGVKLVQNDDDFNAVLVSLGCMGIISSYILEVADMYWLKESKTLYKWSEIKPKLLDKSLLNEARHVMILVNPYRTKGDHTCLVTRIQITTDKPQSRLEKLRSMAARKWSETRIVYWYARMKFWLFSRSTPKLIDRSLRALRDESYINKAHFVLYQGSEFVKERAFDAEFAFDLSGDYVNVIEKIFETTEHYCQKGRIYMTSPVGMRFVKASDAFLAPEYKRDICYVDTPFLQGTVGADELLDACQDLMFEGGGFPHWGKKNSRLSAHVHTIEKTFPRLNSWKTIQKKYDPDGLFANNYTARFLLTE